MHTLRKAHTRQNTTYDKPVLHTKYIVINVSFPSTNILQSTEEYTAEIFQYPILLI